MNSPVNQSNERRTTQLDTVTTDTKYVSNISTRKVPKRYYTTGDDFAQENINDFLRFYGIICLYILLIIVIIIGIGGIIVCAIYYNSTEDTQNWKIGGIVLGILTIVVSVILILIAVVKQRRDKPQRDQIQDMVLHPEKYFTDDSDQSSDEDSDDESETDTDDRHSLSAIANPYSGISKPVPTNQIYCTACERFHPLSYQCKKITPTLYSLSSMNRSNAYQIQQNSTTNQTKKKSLKTTSSNKTLDRSLKHTVSNERHTDTLGQKTNNLVLRRATGPASKVMRQQRKTKIMIVRVPNVAGELVLQPKKS